MRAVLMFHGIDDSSSVLSMDGSQLRSLVRSIRDRGHEIVSLADLLADPAPRRVALTFDDGFRSVAEVASPILAEEAAPATLFLTTSFVASEAKWLGWEQVEALHAGGWAIESHTLHHPDLTRCSDDQLDEELAAPLDIIERRLGRRPQGLAYPFGYLDARVVERARANYLWAVTTTMGAFDRFPDPFRLPRLDSYYLRAPAVHRHFGGFRFGAYVQLRAALRRMKNHPGETGR